MALARPWLPGGASRARRRSDAAVPGAWLRLACVRVITEGLLCSGGPSLKSGECSARAPNANALCGGLRGRRAAALAAAGQRRVQRRAGRLGVKRLRASIAPGFLHVRRHRLQCSPPYAMLPWPRLTALCRACSSACALYAHLLVRQAPTPMSKTQGVQQVSVCYHESCVAAGVAAYAAGANRIRPGRRKRACGARLEVASPPLASVATSFSLPRLQGNASCTHRRIFCQPCGAPPGS